MGGIVVSFLSLPLLRFASLVLGSVGDSSISSAGGNSISSAGNSVSSAGNSNRSARDVSISSAS